MSEENLKGENLSQDETVQREKRKNVSQEDDPQDDNVYLRGCHPRIEKVYFKNRDNNPKVKAALQKCVDILNDAIGKQILFVKPDDEENFHEKDKGKHWSKRNYMEVPVWMEVMRKFKYGYTIPYCIKGTRFTCNAKIALTDAFSELDQKCMESTLCHEMVHALGFKGHFKRRGGRKGSRQDMMEQGCGARMECNNYQWIIGERTIQMLRDYYNKEI